MTPRSNTNIAVESFRASKDLKSLSPDERLIRKDTASLDAFNCRKKISSMGIIDCPIASQNLPRNRGSILTLQRNPSESLEERQVSMGTIWRVGGLAPRDSSDNGRRQVNRDAIAPLYTSSFTAQPKDQDDAEKLANRLAEALKIDRTSRILDFRQPSLSMDLQKKTYWDPIRCQWISNELPPKRVQYGETRTPPLAPFKVLDAPNLRDDFYCSILAYSRICHTLAVALGPLLYSWSEASGVHLLNSGPENGSWITSLGFSSNSGKKSILAFGRSDGSLSLMSLFEITFSRFEIQQPCAVSCLTWRPQTTQRSSKCPFYPGVNVETEDLIVGDEVGNIYYYSIEWPESWEVARNGWSGSITLLARISVHSQQICGLSFSIDGSLFATGGNDNLCCLFQTNTVLCSSLEQSQTEEQIPSITGRIHRVHELSQRNRVKEVSAGSERYRWVHGAAVKAIAFCPWKEGLLATGGGSNDKCIHFYHTVFGTCLATISVSAQVTSLIWSSTRREICATFGYAQPEHPYRIAIFSWPECKQVAAIPWEGDHRALYAIPYPGGPNENHTSREGSSGLSRTAQEGCIVIASSDESVKFQEVWIGCQKTTAVVKGLLGGSDVIEGLESIDKEGEIIR
ncbi:hypothetical protein K3495_g4286 [Podosphaera aphanis]|nr:hypothetical protein K3495_g4286 [Podosphaera aphanis]